MPYPRGCGALKITRALAVVALLAPVRSHAWRAEYPAGTANVVAVDGAGDVVAGGAIQEKFAVVKLAGGSGAQQWIVQGSGASTIFAVTVDAADNVLAAGVEGTRIVLKLASATGAQLWRWNSATSGSASSVVVDGAGDVVVAGQDLASDDLRVAKLAGATGSLVWEYQAAGTGAFGDSASAVAVDALGDVLVTGRLYNTATFDDLFVAKLDGATGAELWRQVIDEGSDAGQLLVVAAGGDAIVAGIVGGLPTVFRFAAATGAELWRAVSTGVHDIALDAAGDVTAAGSTNGLGFVVTRIDGASGASVWSQPVTRAGSTSCFGVALDGSGDAYATGSLEGGVTSHDFAVVKLAGATGTERWRQVLDGSAPFSEESYGGAFYSRDLGLDVAVDGAGGVVAAGRMFNEPLGPAFAVFRLNAVDGGVGPVSGSSIRVTDHAGDPTARGLRVVARDQSIILPLQGSLDDPTIGGGTLRLANPTTPEQATFALPAARWVPVRGSGYAYSDPTGADGPCRKVRIQPGRLRAVCSGRQGAIPFTLDEPSQGSLGVSLTLGGSDPQCGVFESNISRDQGTATPGPRGLFRAGFVLPALGTCP